MRKHGVVVWLLCITIIFIGLSKATVSAQEPTVQPTPLPPVMNVKAYYYDTAHTIIIMRIQLIFNDEVIVYTTAGSRNTVDVIVRATATNVTAFARGKATTQTMEAVAIKDCKKPTIADDELMLIQRIQGEYHTSKLNYDDIQELFKLLDVFLKAWVVPKLDKKEVLPYSIETQQALKILCFQPPEEWLWNNGSVQSTGKNG